MIRLSFPAFVCSVLAGLLQIFFAETQLYAQFGGRKSFNYLNAGYSGRVVGLGGVNLTSTDDDVQMFAHNPSLLNARMSKQIVFSHTSFAGEAGRSFLAGAFEIKQKTFGIFLNYNSYGNFSGTDILGNTTGNFNASDFALGTSYAHKISNYAIGATLKLAGSNIDAFSQYGVFADIGASFIHPEKDLRFALLMKNFGFPLKKFYAGSPYESPADVQLGISFKPEKMPLRTSVTLHQLFNGNIVYNDPNLYPEFDANANIIVREVSGLAKFSRRLVFGGELLLGKNLRFSLGYNVLTRQDMKLRARAGMTGFSYGVFANLKFLEVGLSGQTQYVGGGATTFTLLLHTDRLKKKKTVVE
jgi:hypothetical protein